MVVACPKALHRVKMLRTISEFYNHVVSVLSQLNLYDNKYHNSFVVVIKISGEMKQGELQIVVN